jgi:hypothetical protein
VARQVPHQAPSKPRRRLPVFTRVHTGYAVGVEQELILEQGSYGLARGRGDEALVSCAPHALLILDTSAEAYVLGVSCTELTSQ